MNAKKFFRIENIADQDVLFTGVAADGTVIKDVLYRGEFVYGVHESVAGQLKLYEEMGLIKITETADAEPHVRWLVEGF